MAKLSECNEDYTVKPRQVFELTMDEIAKIRREIIKIETYLGIEVNPEFNEEPTVEEWQFFCGGGERIYVKDAVDKIAQGNYIMGDKSAKEV